MSKDKHHAEIAAEDGVPAVEFDPLQELQKLGIFGQNGEGLPEEIEIEEAAPLDLVEQLGSDSGEIDRTCVTCVPSQVPGVGTQILYGGGADGSAYHGQPIDPYAKDRAEQADKSTGMRFNAGKPRYDLLPPEGIEELVAIYTMGAEKYAARNWEKGISLMGCFASLLRHAFKWAAGQDLDEESGKHHMAHAAWNALAIATFFRRGRKDIDDRPSSQA